MVYLTDGRQILVPLSFFPDIKGLSVKDRSDCGGNLRSSGAESRKIMGTDKSLCSFIHAVDVQRFLHIACAGSSPVSIWQSEKEWLSMQP